MYLTGMGQKRQETVLQLNLHIVTFQLRFNGFWLTSRYGINPFFVNISYSSIANILFALQRRKAPLGKGTRQTVLGRACFYWSVWYTCLLEAGQRPLEKGIKILHVKPLQTKPNQQNLPQRTRTLPRIHLRIWNLSVGKLDTAKLPMSFKCLS